MMMTQSHYGGGSDFDAFQHQPYHRPMSQGSYYDRSAIRNGPYNYYDTRYELRADRHDIRPDYQGRLLAHTPIHEHEQHVGVGGQARRRIAVACARCRRRKIKCSGDPGDGTGCLHCKSSGANVQDCAFMRVQSREVVMLNNSRSVKMLPATVSDSSLSGTPAQYGMETTSASASYPTTYNAMPYRPSLPTLQTRTTYSQPDYDSQYDHSPADSYTYSSSSLPRQDSITSAYLSHDSSRSYGMAPLSAPASAPSYDQQVGCSFGTLYSPMATRLPSVTGDPSTALNMGSLHSSLPHAAERRLPAPYGSMYGQSQPAPQPLPNMRAFDINGFRPHVNGIHSRTAMGWTTNGDSTGSAAIYSQAYPTPSNSHGMRLPPHSSSQQSSLQAAVTSSMSDAGEAFGYHFHQSAPHAEAISPGSISTASNSFTSTATSSLGMTTYSMPPPSSIQGLRCAASNSSLPQLPAVEDTHASTRPSSSRHQEGAVNLYSFSTESSSEQRAPSLVSSASQIPVSSPAEADYTSLSRQPHAHHTSSYENLRSSSGQEQQPRNSRPVHRSSVQSLNEGYS